MKNEQEKGWIIDVIPLTKINLSRQQFFSYLNDEPITKGSLVSVPFFRRNIQGIVINSRTDFHRLGNFKLKKIEKILQESFLSEQQLELAQFISDYYFSPLGIALRHFIVKPTKERKVKTVQPKSKVIKTPIILNESQKNATREIVNSFQNKNKFLLYGPSSSGKTEVYIQAIKNLRDEEQVLILLPELTLAPQAIEKYSEVFPEEKIALLHSKISKGSFYTNWLEISNGKKQIIIGTRAAIFAPFKNLKLIIVDEEHDMSFKQWDMNPRYDARHLALILSNIHNASVVFGSATPRIETFFKTKEGHFQLLELSDISKKRSVEIIDMRKETWTDFKKTIKPNYSFLSRRLQEELSYALNHKLQSIIFINHQGMNKFTICTSCKSTLKCPRCERALVYSNEGYYRCMHCSYKTDLVPSCNNCGGLQFKNIGHGTENVEKEILKYFPDARTIIADTHTTKTKNDFNKIYKAVKNQDADIIIGTQMITKGWDFPKMYLSAVIDADSLTSIPDFYADEKAFANIMQVAGRTGRTQSAYVGKVLIQTYDPENIIYKSAQNSDYTSFYENELKIRQQLKYPPFGRIIKLVYQDSNLKKVENSAQKLYSDIIGYRSMDLSIFGPITPFASKIRDNYRKQIILRINSNNSLNADLWKIISSLGEGWIVDVDPVSIA